MCHRRLIIIGFALLVSACAAPTASPTATQTPLRVVQATSAPPTPSATRTPSSTPTLKPTQTSVPTDTLTPLPTRTPAPAAQCPPPGNPISFSLADADYYEAGALSYYSNPIFSSLQSQILTYLNARGSADGLQDALNALTGTVTLNFGRGPQPAAVPTEINVHA